METIHKRGEHSWIGNLSGLSNLFLKFLVAVYLLPVSTAAEDYYEYSFSYYMMFNQSCFEAYNYTLDGIYCETFPQYSLCWPPTPAGETATIECPQDPQQIHSISRKCQEDGTWEFQDLVEIDQECTRYYMANSKLALSCNFISLVACIIAFIILAVSRSLWCTRNYIHWHLITSFGCKYLMACILVSSFFIMTARGVDYTTSGRIAVTVFTAYFEMTSFFWMFVEGLYLHTVVALAFRFDIDKIKFMWYCALGWAAPVIFCGTYLIVIIVGDGNLESPKIPIAQNILVVLPITAVLVLNSIFLLNIVRILMSKLRESSGDTQLKHYRRTARATLVLVILLGVSYVFPIFIMNLIRGLPKGVLLGILMANSILSGLQGFLVALIYVFMNSEVKAVLSRKWERCFGFTPCPRRSNDYHAANTTFSRMDDTSMVNTVHAHNESGNHNYRGSPNTNNNQRANTGAQTVGNGILANQSQVENLEMSQTSGEASSSPMNGVAKEESSPLLAGNVIINENGRTLVHDHEDIIKEQMKKGTDV